MILLTLLAAAALHDLVALGAQVSDFAGRPVAIDPRLRLPACGHSPIIAQSVAAGTIAVECTAPAWRIFVAAPGAAAVLPTRRLIARGDAVAVSAGGPGFRVSVEGIAENDAGAGERLRIRVEATGARLTALVAADGSVALPGYNSDAPSR